jgi:DNA-binding response OmpR family regulator
VTGRPSQDRYPTVEWQSGPPARGRAVGRGAFCMQILVNERQQTARKTLRAVLERSGHTVVEAESTRAAMALLANTDFDLLITDLSLPDTDGLDLVRQVRQRSTIPILIVSVRAEITDRVRSLRLGADDYLVKPFDASELAARVEALLRRSRALPPLESTGVVKAGDVSIDLVRHVATVAGRGPTEVRVLLRLARPPGEVRSRAELAQAVWGDAPAASTGAINTYIADLRRKLEPFSGRPRLLQTVRGVGYRLAT